MKPFKIRALTIDLLRPQVDAEYDQWIDAARVVDVVDVPSELSPLGEPLTVVTVYGMVEKESGSGLAYTFEPAESVMQKIALAMGDVAVLEAGKW